MDRRRFLQHAGALAAAGAVGAWPRPAAALPRGFVLEVHEPGLSMDSKHVDPGRMSRTIDRLLMAVTGDSSPVRAILRFVSPLDTVGLKVSALGGPHMAFHPVATRRLLSLLADAGVPPERTFVYDQFGSRMRRAGYTLSQPGATGVRVLHHKSEGWGYETTAQRYDEDRSFRWSVLFKHCTAILNLVVPKDHDLVGVSGALTNMALGNLTDPAVFHRDLPAAVPRLYARPEITSRVRLVLCDASRVLYHGGPQDNPVRRAQADSMLAGTDPVAMDWAIAELVNEHRSLHQLLPLQEVQRPRERAPVHLHAAARAGLGGGLDELSWWRVAPDGRRRQRWPRHLSGMK